MAATAFLFSVRLPQTYKSLFPFAYLSSRLSLSSPHNHRSLSFSSGGGNGSNGGGRFFGGGGSEEGDEKGQRKNNNKLCGFLRPPRASGDQEIYYHDKVCDTVIRFTNWKSYNEYVGARNRVRILFLAFFVVIWSIIQYEKDSRSERLKKANEMKEDPKIKGDHLISGRDDPARLDDLSRDVGELVYRAECPDKSPPRY